MGTPLNLLLVEDCEEDAMILLRKLKLAGYDVCSERVDQADTLKAALSKKPWDLVISDFSMPSFDGLHALSLVKAEEIDAPFILVSGAVGEETAVNAMKAGAHDYVMKGNFGRLIPAIERELRESKMRKELKDAEEQLRITQKMDAIGRLAGGIAHDFNNLLTVITGYCEMLEKENLPPQSKEKVGVIAQTGRRAARLTAQLLNLSRKQITCAKPENLNDIISEAQGMFAPLIGAKVQVKFDPGQPLDLVKVDKSQFDQILMNLVVNARDAMPDGGDIVIETANVSINDVDRAMQLDPAAESYVMLAVSDTGTGMDKETQKKIFEPLFTTKEVGKGTGLGLSVVYGIVKRCGGGIAVSSELGKGTTFRIYFPRAEAMQPSQTKKENLSAASRRAETILLVENDSAVRKISAEILKKNGNSILEAADGLEALKLLENYEGRVDLVVTDMAMEKMDGPQLVENLRKTHPHIRSLFISGYATSEVAPGNDNENLALLCKPFLPHELEAMVRKVLE